MLPSLDIVYVTTGGGFEPGDATGRIGAALADMERPIAENPEGLAALKDALGRIAEPPAPSAPSLLPAMAQAISGKTYVFEANPYNIKSQRVDFTEDAREARFTLIFGDRDKPQDGTVGLDGVYRMVEGRYGFLVGLRGRWTGKDTFALEYDEIANRDAYLIRMRFDGGRLGFSAQERTHAAPVILHARQQ